MTYMEQGNYDPIGNYQPGCPNCANSRYAISCDAHAVADAHILHLQWTRHLQPQRSHVMHFFWLQLPLRCAPHWRQCCGWILRRLAWYVRTKCRLGNDGLRRVPAMLHRLLRTIVQHHVQELLGHLRDNVLFGWLCAGFNVFLRPRTMQCTMPRTRQQYRQPHSVSFFKQ